MEYLYTVYKIINEVNGKIYIGIHKTADLNDGYMGSGALVQKAIKKYGIECFRKEYLAIYDNPEEMFNMESKLVNEDFIKRNDTYNLKEGGLGGDTSDFIKYKSPEYKDSLRKAMKCFFENNPEYAKQSSERIKKYSSIAFKGKKHTEKTKKVIGEKNSKYQKGKGNSQYGKCWIYSLELKISKSIQKTDLNSFLEEGWKKGRKIKFD